MTDRRITEYAVAEGAEADIAAEIATKTHYGILQGVEVDFRHASLPVDEWHASPWWDVWGDGTDHAGVIFPDEAAWGDIAEIKRRKGIDDTFPVIYVSAGDKISVEEVLVHRDDRIFDHAHDSETRLAFLKITRRDGSTVVLNKPMMFHGATRLRNEGWRLQFDNMLDRIKRHNGVESVFDYPVYGEPIPETGILLSEKRQALLAARDAYESFFNILDALDKIDAPNVGQLKAGLRNLANQSARAALLLGKVEAQRAEDIASNAVKGGKRMGLANANQYWVDEAERLWNENPNWTLNRIAETISHGEANDKRSIMKARGVVLACPRTSSSWAGCQKKIIEKGW